MSVSVMVRRSTSAGPRHRRPPPGWAPPASHPVCGTCPWRRRRRALLQEGETRIPQHLDIAYYVSVRRRQRAAWPRPSRHPACAVPLPLAASGVLDPVAKMVGQKTREQEGSDVWANRCRKRAFAPVPSRKISGRRKLRVPAAPQASREHANWRPEARLEQAADESAAQRRTGTIFLQGAGRARPPVCLAWEIHLEGRAEPTTPR